MCLHAQIECVPVFTKEYSEVNVNFEPYAMKYFTDGSSVIAGRQKRNTQPDYDGMVMKLSANGTPLWCYSIGGDKDDIFNNVLSLKNGDFILYGTSSSFGIDAEKIWMVKISGTGAVIWNKQMMLGKDGNDRIKAMIELPDNSIIGTLNSNDSTSKSNPVLFKMDANGNLIWAHLFNDGNDDNFSSIAFYNDTIYAGGYYTNTIKHGVIVKIKNDDGTLISSQTVFNSARYTQQEVLGLEVYNNIISYGLYAYEDEDLRTLILRQTDMAGNNLFSRALDNTFDSKIIKVQRTKDQGFFVLREGKPSYSPNVTKYNRYGLDDWGAQFQDYYFNQKNYTMDTTADGGCVSIGFYNSYYSGYKNIARMSKISGTGYAGICSSGGAGLFSDTGTCETINFKWENNADTSLQVADVSGFSTQTFTVSVNVLCDTSICTDKTPLPPGCNKTFRNEYAGEKYSSFKDMLTTNDGGKIAVGYLQNDALIVKLDKNSDVVWSKNYEDFYHTSEFLRILKADNNNYFVFSNTSYVVDHEGGGYGMILKINNSGNVLWKKNIHIAPIADVKATPDNGFIIIMNGAYGLGYTYSYVLRFDANGNVVWKKELKHNAAVPVYRSIAVGNKSVYLAWDSYDNYNWDKFGVDKLDYSTGNQIWSNRYATSNSNNVERIYNIYAINDSAYVFINNLNPLGFDIKSKNFVLTILGPNGKVAQSFTLSPGTILPFDYWYYENNSVPAITMNPDFDFVFTSRVVNGSDTTLNITRFSKTGQKVWSHNFPGMKNYTPLNIHSQANGFLITGSTVNNLNFKNSFLLKIDSNGTVIPSAFTGDCRYTNNNLIKGSVTVSLSYNAIDSVVNIPDAYITNANTLSQDVFVDAVPYCGASANCGVVGFKQKGNGCSLSDTLEYYLEDAANCDAAATWKYDTSFFKPAFVNGNVIDLLPLRSGVSSVTAFIEGNCSYTEKTLIASIAVSANNLTLGNDTIICNNSTIKLNAGAGFKTYTWQDNSTDSIFAVTAPGKYYVTVTDYCGGTAADTVNIQSPNLSFNLTNDTSKCNGDSVVLTATAGYNNYQWSPAYFLSANGDSATVKPAVTTRYYVQAEMQRGCTVSDSVLITVITTPSINLGNDTSICAGESVTLNAGNGFETYSWNTGENSETITVASKGAYYVTAYKNSCFSTDTLEILNVSAPPYFSLGNDTALCPMAHLDYNFNIDNAKYQWSDGSFSNTNIIRQPGTYWLTVIQNGCAASDTVLVNSKPGPVVFLGNDTTLCSGTTLLLSAYNDNATYLWQDNSILPTYSVTQQGMYYAIAMLNNCTAADTINVYYKTTPVFSLGSDSLICPGVPLTLSAATPGALSYKWQDRSTADHYIASTPGLYSVQVTNECGTTTEAINITNALCVLEMPDAFTPNRDGKNDKFGVKYPQFIKSFHMTIYNRWGNKIFETKNPYEKWDGTLNSYPQNIGSYVWIIEFTDNNNKQQTAHGMVTLLR